MIVLQSHLQGLADTVAINIPRRPGCARRMDLNPSPGTGPNFIFPSPTTLILFTTLLDDMTIGVASRVTILRRIIKKKDELQAAARA
jgi:hypothetical protein